MGEKNIKKTTLKELSLNELSLFSYQFSIILKSGVPYLEGIEIFMEEADNKSMKNLIQILYEDLKSGKKIHESFEETGVFPKYFVQMTKLAERAGTLDVEMENLSQFYEEREKTRYEIRSALVYPIVLFLLMSSVIVLLVVKVFPIFQEVLTSLGGDLSTSSSFIFGISKVLQQGLFWILGGVLLVILILIFYSKTNRGKILSDKFKLNSGLTKNLYQKLITLRFAQGLSMMVAAGISFEDGILLSAPLTENQYAQKRIEKAQDSVSKGISVVESLKEIELFPSLFIQMLRIGFKSGQVDSMLAKLTEIYRLELKRATKKFTSSIEPVLVIILSVVVALILLTVMLPMIQIMSSMG